MSFTEISFTERALTVIITAGAKSSNNPNPISFGPNKQNTLTLAGYRVSCSIAYAGGNALVAAQISVYGMNESDMNEIASIGQLLYKNNLNSITVLAGDNENGMTIAFQGTMQTAVINTSGAPEISFDMTAYTGYALAMTPIPPASFSGAASVAGIMANFAQQGGLIFENNGVSSVLSNPYFAGTLGNQIKSCAQAAGINFIIDPKKGFNGTLAIWPKNGFRSGNPPTISKHKGMVGYPRYTAQGIDVDMLYNSTILFASQINVVSDLAPANGLWNVYSLSHNLDSITPNGDWMTTVSCFSPKNFFGLGISNSGAQQ
jgi:hypothetical protein